MPIFLEEASVDSLKEQHNRIVFGNWNEAVSTYTRARKIIFSKDWDKFDDFYFACYIINLINCSKQHRIKKIKNTISLDNSANAFLNRSVKDIIVRIDFMLDIELAVSPCNDYNFISETSVATILNFRKAFNSHFKFEKEVIYFDLGCLLCSFGVLVPNAMRLSRLYGRDDPDVFSIGYLEGVLKSESWRAVAEAFRVKNHTCEVLVS